MVDVVAVLRFSGAEERANVVLTTILLPTYQDKIQGTLPRLLVVHPVYIVRSAQARDGGRDNGCWYSPAYSQTSFSLS